ncbi:UBX domain protein [Trichuris suis]|nr:UBX domain protein [Trichuris suis]
MFRWLYSFLWKFSRKLSAGTTASKATAAPQPAQPVIIEDGYEGVYSDQTISPSVPLNPTWRTLKHRTYESLFRPPVDLMFHGSWEAARIEAKAKNRWLLINIQDPKEFSCQVLNRDIWTHSAVRDLVSNNFIFYQVLKTSSAGHRLCGYYTVDTFPFVGIVDPRTGQFMTQLNTTDAVICCEKIATFLEDHPSPSGNFTGTFDPDIVFLGASSPASTNGTQVTHEVRKRLSDISLDGKDVNKKQRIDELVEAFHEASSSSNGSVEDLTWEKFIVKNEAENVSEPYVTLIFRFANGSRSICRFLTTARVRDVCAYVEQRLHYPARSRNLALGHPRRVFTHEHADRTLAELHLNSHEVVDFERRGAKIASTQSIDN